jgi:hypothetical protein
MPDCPFCGDSFLNEEERNNHIVVAHPEKTGSAEAYGKAMSEMQIPQIAASLTSTAMALSHSSLYSPGIPREKVLETYKYFLDELRAINRRG